MFVYKIQNKISGKVYIGQSTQTTIHRLQEHKSKLRSGIHENEHLQKSWNKYTEHNFEFVVLATCDTLEKLNELEELYITEYNALDRLCGYNIRGGGNNRFMNEETKKKISNTKLGVPVHTDESKRKIAKYNSGRVHTLESRLKRSQKLKGIKWSASVKLQWAKSHRNNVPYPILVSPSGKEHFVQNMTAFCRKYKLIQQSMSSLVTGKRTIYKGWHLKIRG